MAHPLHRAWRPLGVLLSLSLLLGLAGCKTPGAADTEIKDTKTSGAQLDAVMKDNLFGLCVIAEDTARTKGDEVCKAEIILGVCGQQQTSLDAAVASLLEADLAKQVVTASKQQQMAADIKADFKEAIDRCLNAQVYRNEDYNQKMATDPLRQEKRQAARIRFWRSMALGAIYGVARGAGIYLAEKRVKGTFKQVFWSGICMAATSTISGFIEENPPDHNRSACSKVNEYDSTRMKACFNTASTACGAAGGFVDIGSIPGLQTESEALSFITDITSVGVETACRIGGKVSGVACGTINAAAGQIAKFLQTGNNDWAECTVNPWARCLGEIWGQGGWSNNSGVEVPRQVTTISGEKWWVKGCCLCKRNWYRNQSWARDPVLRNEFELSVIQNGDFAAGNCGIKNGKSYDQRDGTYYTYGECQRVEVVGGRCALQYGDGEGGYYDVTQRLWDVKTNSRSRRLSRANGIH